MTAGGSSSRPRTAICPYSKAVRGNIEVTTNLV